MLGFFKYLRMVIALALLATLGFLTHDLSVRALAHQQRKYDDSNINYMRYGMFNVNIWKEKLTNIIVEEIQNFKIDKKSRSALQNHVESQLINIVEKFETQFNQGTEGTVGWIKKKVVETFVDVEEIKNRRVPEYAKVIVDEMVKDETQKQLKQVIRTKVKSYLDGTFEIQKFQEVEDIVARYGKGSVEATQAHLRAEVPKETAYLYQMTNVLIAVAVGLFLVCFMDNWKSRMHPVFFFCGISGLALLLYLGVSCPMIDMEAKITKFGFMLIGHEILFENQIVYFQSKSIIDVFWLLMTDPDVKMQVVGVLMIVFSIVFPVTKMLSSIFYYYDIWGSQNRWWAKFFVLHSGKWSFTDTQVVAILMAYIGFNGMVTTQFKSIAATMPSFTFISNNGTVLQIGFYIFLAYVFLAMFLALRLKKRQP